MNVFDFMTRKVVTVAPETPVIAVAKLLVERRLSAVPVTDPQGRVLGIISEGDLMRRPEIGTETHAPWWFRAFAAPDTLAKRFVKSHGLVATDVMTRGVVTIALDASLAEAAELMEQYRVKRLPVTQEDRLIGVIARADLVRALVAAPPPAAGADDDAAVRERLEDAFERERWVPFDGVAATVVGHTAHLWGSVPSDEQRKAVELLARGVPGVEAVKNHLTVEPGEVRGPLLLP